MIRRLIISADGLLKTTRSERKQQFAPYKPQLSDANARARVELDRGRTNRIVSPPQIELTTIKRVFVNVRPNKYWRPSRVASGPWTRDGNGISIDRKRRLLYSMYRCFFYIGGFLPIFIGPSKTTFDVVSLWRRIGVAIPQIKFDHIFYIYICIFLHLNFVVLLFEA